MLTSPLAPYLYWAKTRPAAAIDLAGSNLLACSLDDLPGAREAVELTAPDRDGFPPLLEAIAAHYGVTIDHAVTAPGCSAANYLAIAALVGAGDDVVMEAPWYDQITGACELMGARVRHFPRRFDDGYRVDVAEVRAHLTPATRLVIVTSPHNPSGTPVDAETLRGLQALAETAGLFVLVDEVYLDALNLLQPRGTGAPRAAGGRYPPAALLGDRLISVSSLTKSYGLAGLRCGWAIAAPALIARMRRVRDVIDNIGAAPADRLSAVAFAHLGRLAARSRALLSANLDLTRRFLSAHPELEITQPPQATIVFPRLSGVADADPFVQRLLTAHGVAVAPGRFFGAPAHFRLALAGRTETLAAGLDELDRALAAGRSGPGGK